MALVTRDPFAREELHREQVEAKYYGNSCDWCGSLNRNGKLYVYHTESDGGSHRRIKGAFCCAACFRSYHDAED